jgi:ATP-binding cassette, subfamily B (MDR/TAP), member 1
MQDAKTGEESSKAARTKSDSAWKHLFKFTQVKHLPALLPAICCSFIAGATKPVMTIYIGKFFTAFGGYTAKQVSLDDFKDRTLTSIYGFIVIGVATLAAKGGSTACWMIFGEMQARQIREQLFEGLLEKDLEWFDMREQVLAH